MTKKTWGVIAGSTIMIISIGGYLLWKQRKQRQTAEIQLGITSGSAKRIFQNTSGIAITEPNWKNPYDMNYIKDVKNWLKGKRMKELNPHIAVDYAKRLKTAKGKWDDKEEVVEWVFNQLQDKTQVASIAKAFYKAHNQMDMWRYLRSFLSDSELKRYVHIPVRKLPNYRLV